MHTKRNRKHHYSRRRHCRSRRAGGPPKLPASARNSLASARKSLASAIGKTQFLGHPDYVVNHKGIHYSKPSTFTGTMHKHGQYIQGNLFYYEKNGKNKVGVHATEFDYSNNPCGTVTRINMDGTSMLDNFGRPIIENVTCGRGHVSEHPFDQ